MKHPIGNRSSLFCEQVSTVTLLFEKWNECERTVVMYALLKRLSFPTLKFLQISIENNLTQNFCSQENVNMLETNANNSKHLEKLVAIYKSLSIVELSQIVDKDSILYESDFCMKTMDKNYSHKEDILYDILNMLPLLKPGNEEAKKFYLTFIPMAVEDTVRQLVATELVQQIFSYLLIHPAISNEDRRSLSHWLRHLEEHIQSSFASGHRGFYIFNNSNDTTTETPSIATSLSNSCQLNIWQAVAPPSNKQSSHYQSAQQLSHLTSSLNSSSSTSSSEWNLNILSLPPSSGLKKFNSSQNSLGIMPSKSIESDNVTEDSHISFSKNGTEVLDFEDNGIYNTFDTYIGSHLHVQAVENIDNSMLNAKTRRSNSLTIPSSISYKLTESNTRHSTCSNSIDNLTQLTQKPRSFSLSIENSKNAIHSSVSETNLDNLKPNYLKFTTRNIGMSNIGQWLKSLRLHKYIDLFKNMTYEEMLGITENYLQCLGVTKGASHKLALCIEKLKGRFIQLSAIEVNLLQNKISLSSAIEALADSVLTPMKPINSPDNDNVACKFLRVLDIVYQSVLKRGMTSSAEECINGIIWILDRALHNEAFVDQSRKLKEYKLKLSKFKTQFIQKAHLKGNGSSSSISKSRWNSSKGRKLDFNGKIEPNERMVRKNPNEVANFNSITLHRIRKASMHSSNISQNYVEFEKVRPSKIKNQYYSATNIASSPGTSTNNSQFKSASYPNFSSNISTVAKVTQESKRQERLRHNRFEQQNESLAIIRNSTIQQESGFCNSRASNFTVEEPSTAQTYSLTGKQSPPNRQLSTSTQGNLNFAEKKRSNNVKTKSNGSSGDAIKFISNSSNSICDINNSLEFLCLQMTEQAIN